MLFMIAFAPGCRKEETINHKPLHGKKSIKELWGEGGDVHAHLLAEEKNQA
jgi:hypothetical protein